MRKRPRVKRLYGNLGRGLLVVSALAFGTALGGLVWAYRSLPSWSGTFSVPGLRAPLRIVRDTNAIPHVLAQSEPDAYFGLGYVHAQDRLWQLELNRRAGTGRLAEVFGPDVLWRDRLFRTLGLRQAAERSLANLDTETRGVVDAYVAGVNAYLERHEPLPPEFGLLGITPEPWTAVDSLVWLKLMAWMLSGNLDSELWRWRLSERLGPREIAEFLAPYPGDEPIVLDERPGRYGELPKRTGMHWTPRGTYASGLGSNNWVVDGRNTQSGKPLLANDPHLRLTSPGIWYLAHLSAPGLDAVGGTLPSLPGVVLGHNGSVAWAFTNTGSDTQDVFVERLMPGDPSRYVTPDGPAEFELRRELIRVKGEADAVLLVRSSRHGPVISDVYEPATDVTPEGHVLALAWTALRPDDATPRFALAAARARNAAELRAAARNFHAPPQNIVYADTAGEIGFVAAGRVPLRKPENNLRGLAPAPGWLRVYDWDGHTPVEPEQQNPASGHIVTANQKVAPPEYPYWLGAEWAEPFRAARIEQLLGASSSHTVEGFIQMQLDVDSGPAHVLLPRLLAATRPPAAVLAPRERAAHDALSGWNLQMRADLGEPLVFAEWIRQLARSIYADELGELFEDAWAERIGFLGNVLSNRNGQAHWCDDIGTPAAEDCDSRIQRALVLALDELEQRHGADQTSWRWGDAHQARARHTPMTRVPVLRDWFDVVSPADGAVHTVNVGAYDLEDDDPFESQHAAGYRAVYDLSNLQASRFLINTGQSGHVLSPHYRDWVEPWRRGALVAVPTDRAAVARGAADELLLEPRR
jgi:penicillin amidase